MNKERLYHAPEMSEVLQKEYTKATGLSPLFEGEPDHYYIRWLEIRIYEAEGRPQPLYPKEYCGTCKQMVHFEGPVSPWPMCPNCFDKENEPNHSN